MNFPSFYASNLLFGKEELQIVGNVQITSDSSPLQTTIEFIPRVSDKLNDGFMHSQ